MQSKEFQGRVQLQSQTSVIAVNSPLIVYWLTSLTLSMKESLELFPGCRQGLLWPTTDSPANQPGSGTLHMAPNLFCYYHPPPATVCNSKAFITALCYCCFVAKTSYYFCLCAHTFQASTEGNFCWCSFNYFCS